jgi:hypothetical protein
MPNHVYTNTEFHTTDPEQRATLKRLAENNESIIAHYVPLPDQYSETKSWTNHNGETFTTSVFTEGGYNAAIDLWGSKWADYELEVMDETPEVISIRHQSAWAPSNEGLRKVSAILGITISTSYTEESGEFVGAAIFHKGACIAEEEICGTEYYEELDKRLVAAGQPAECPDWDDDEKWMEWQNERSALEGDILVECEDKAWATASAFLADTLALNAIHSVLDGQDCGSEEMGEVLNLVINSGRPIRDPE